MGSSALTVFDFVSWTAPEGTGLPSLEIYSLLTARDGSLWIGTRRGLARWRDGILVNYTDPPGAVFSSAAPRTARIKTPSDDGRRQAFLYCALPFPHPTHKSGVNCHVSARLARGNERSKACTAYCNKQEMIKIW
jgi:Two component regulator propeller